MDKIIIDAIIHLTEVMYFCVFVVLMLGLAFHRLSK